MKTYASIFSTKQQQTPNNGHTKSAETFLDKRLRTGTTSKLRLLEEEGEMVKDSYERERSNETNHIIIVTRRSQGPKDHNTNFSPRNTPPGQRNFGGQNRLNFQKRPQRNNERFRNYDQNRDYRKPPGTQYNHCPPPPPNQ